MLLMLLFSIVDLLFIRSFQKIEFTIETNRLGQFGRSRGESGNDIDYFIIRIKYILLLNNEPFSNLLKPFKKYSVCPQAILKNS